MARPKELKQKNDFVQVPKPEITLEILSRWHYLLPSFFLALCSFLFYRPSLHYSFQFDDIANIQKFFAIRHLTLHDLWFQHARWISYWLNAINYSIGKFDPYSYRCFNVLFHT